jgi:riboflavin-specific deaminase-like protein
MTSPIDSTAAWDLVRAVPCGLPEGTVRLFADGHEDLWLEVDDQGGWSTSADCSAQARQIFDLYLPLQLQADLVIAQLGQSLDGRIATESGHSFWVTGPEDIRRLHRLRALVDAVVIGAGTAIQDNPRLTVREVPGEHPRRVIIDPDQRVPPSNRVLTTGDRPAIAIRRAGGAAAASADAGVHADTGAGYEVLELPMEGRFFDPHTIIDALRARGLRRLLIEGGGVTVSGFVQAAALDRLHVTVAPLLLGSGLPALTLEPIVTLDEALRPRCRRFHLGADVLFDLELR